MIKEDVKKLVNGTEALDMSAVKLNDIIGYQIDFTNDSFIDKDMWIAIAAYDSSGNLIAVNDRTVRSDAAGKIQGEVNITVDTEEKLQQMATVKGFCWDASELIPACDAAVATK